MANVDILAPFCIGYLRRDGLYGNVDELGDNDGRKRAWDRRESN